MGEVAALLAAVVIVWAVIMAVQAVRSHRLNSAEWVAVKHPSLDGKYVCWTVEREGEPAIEVGRVPAQDLDFDFLNAELRSTAMSRANALNYDKRRGLRA